MRFKKVYLYIRRIDGKSIVIYRNHRYIVESKYLIHIEADVYIIHSMWLYVCL